MRIFSQSHIRRITLLILPSFLWATLACVSLCAFEDAAVGDDHPSQAANLVLASDEDDCSCTDLSPASMLAQQRENVTQPQATVSLPPIDEWSAESGPRTARCPGTVAYVPRRPPPRPLFLSFRTFRI